MTLQPAAQPAAHTTPLPTFAQVLELPALIETTVQPEYIDFYGHMNVRFYLILGAEAVGLHAERIGIDSAYHEQRRMGVFTAEHHLRYFSELSLGDKLSVHSRFLDRSRRAGHIMSFLLDRERDRLAYTLELIVVHMDTTTRRPVDMPDDIARGFDEQIALSRALNWPAPTCGVMGIRR
ncbi:thioesterase family protein [Protofrankia coriariae]|uniref:thioesterase family protein n=1 Tax=Protofrankia coriariae TaxID=1562887 RepID=UPI00069B15F0|nr:thioesterase family protein [Protofrankia coriariae]